MLNYTVPTGTMIKEYLDARGISQKEFATRSGLSEKHISNIINSHNRLTEEVALKLEKIIDDVPASFWLNLEAKYREMLAREQEMKLYSSECKKEYSKKFMFDVVFKGLKWSLERQMIEMLKILQISDFANFDATYASLDAHFMEDGGHHIAQIIWLKLCEDEIIVQNDIPESAIFKKENLKKRFSEIQSLVQNQDAKKSIEQVKAILNQEGINLVLKEAIRNSKIRGCLTTYQTRPTIYLSGRYKTHDHIWFALLHEIGHLMLHYQKGVTIITYNDEESLLIKDDAILLREKEANTFARDFLINPLHYQQFIQKEDFTPAAMNQFANVHHIRVGLLVGRLLHDGYLKDYKLVSHLLDKIK